MFSSASRLHVPDGTNSAVENRSVRDDTATSTLPDVFGEQLGAAPRLGRIYGGYRTLDLIAEGGMGAIYRAEELSTGAEVALKTLGTELVHDVIARARLLQEGETTRRCRHPNVVRLLASGENTGGEPFLALELLPGPTLSQYLRRQGSLPVGDVAWIACQMLRALERIHAMQVIHRDIKTDNFIFGASLSGKPRVKIIDFGIARVLRRNRKTTAPDFATNLLVGTPRYMSPEQAKCEREIDARSDLYSLGVVLYQLLTGSFPYPNQEASEHEAEPAALFASGPVHLLDRRMDVPRSFADVVMQALAHSRDERWPSARAMRGALERAIRRREGSGWS